MEIPNTWAPMLVSAVRDAVLYQARLRESETLRDRADYEEHLVQLSQFLEYLNVEYKKLEDEAGIPLDKLL